MKSENYASTIGRRSRKVKSQVKEETIKQGEVGVKERKGRKKEKEKKKGKGK